MKNQITEEFLKEEYVKNKRSFSDIAKELGTYTNKVVREARKLGIKPRDKSEAQKVALKSGRHAHPTKGKKRTGKAKEKISNSVYDFWDNMPDDDRLQRAAVARANWENMSEEQKQNFHRLSGEAIRKASREGSKLEKFLLTALTEAGIKVEFHKEHLLLNENLHIDLFLPEINVAIEVDGPSHFEPIWGEEALERTQKSDRQKNGLILNSGFVLIRVKQKKTISEKYKRDLSTSLICKLREISDKYPSRENRYIEIGE